MSIIAVLKEKTRPDGNPCVRNCCLDDNDICLGCGRQLTEILEWHDADSSRQQQIIDNAKDRISERNDYKVGQP